MFDRLTIAVSGATGQQGGALARSLIRRGHNVRALARNSEGIAAQKLAHLGAQIVVADFGDKATLDRAMAGVDTVFAMATPFGPNGAAQETIDGLALTDAAARAGVGHLVYSSVAGASLPTGVPHFDSKHSVERHLVSLDLPSTIVGPVYFFENLVAPWAIEGLRRGRIEMALPPDRRLQYVAVADVGEALAAVIERRQEMFGARVEVAGDERTGPEIAEILSRVSGQPISYFPFPASMLRGETDDLFRMFDWLGRVGFSADIAGLQNKLPEVHFQMTEEWARGLDWQSLLPLEPARASYVES